MPIYTREEIAVEIGRWKDALKACATGKNYTIDGRQLQDVPAEKGVYIVNGRKVVVK